MMAVRRLASPAQLSVTRRVAVNTVAQVGGRLAGAAISLVVLRLSTRYLGVDDYGSVVAATALVTLLSTLADWGLGTIAGREMARDPDRVESILSATVGIRLLMGVALIPVTVALGALMYHGQHRTMLAVAVLSPLMLTTALQSAGTALLVATQRNHLAAIADVASRVVVLAAVVAVVTTNLGFQAYLWTSVAGGVVAAATALAVTARYARIRVHWRPAAWWPLLAMALPLGLAQIANVVYLRLDSMLLSLMRTPAELGRYGVAYKVVEFVMAVPSFFMLALLPNLAVASPERAARLVQRAFDVLATAGVLACVGGVLLAPGIVVAVSSSAYLPAATALAILCVAAGLSYVAAVAGNALVALGRQGALLRLIGTLVAVNLVLNLAVIPRFGIEGAAAAVAATELLGVVYVTALLARTTGIRIRLRGAAPAVLAGCAMGATGAALRLAGVDPAAPLGFAITAALSCGAFAAGLTAFGGLRAMIRGAA